MISSIVGEMLVVVLTMILKRKQVLRGRGFYLELLGAILADSTVPNRVSYKDSDLAVISVLGRGPSRGFESRRRVDEADPEPGQVREEEFVSLVQDVFLPRLAGVCRCCFAGS